jgi:hypothetical protein
MAAEVAGTRRADGSGSHSAQMLREVFCYRQSLREGLSGTMRVIEQWV